MVQPILSIKQSQQLLGAKQSEVTLSVDLGLTQTRVMLHDANATVKDLTFPLSSLKRIKDDDLYVYQDEAWRKIAFFSDETNFFYKLVATKDWPTITLSSTRMHRASKVHPKEDTQTKIAEIAPVKGRVLDTCCGLGYTAILAAEHAQQVDVFERDPNVLRIAGFNPYSTKLFSSANIKLHEEDVAEGIIEFADRTFDRIIHDPPTVKYSPYLYTAEFYQELFRVLKPNGILYHYCPSPHRTRGEILYPRIMRLLKEAGFKDVEYQEKSSGIRGVK